LIIKGIYVVFLLTHDAKGGKKENFRRKNFLIRCLKKNVGSKISGQNSEISFLQIIFNFRKIMFISRLLFKQSVCHFWTSV